MTPKGRWRKYQSLLKEIDRLEAEIQKEQNIIRRITKKRKEVLNELLALFQKMAEEGGLKSDGAETD